MMGPVNRELRAWTRKVLLQELRRVQVIASSSSLLILAGLRSYTSPFLISVFIIIANARRTDTTSLSSWT